MPNTTESLRVYVGDIVGAYSKDAGACQRLPYGMSREEQRRMMLAHLDEMSKALSLTLPALTRLEAAKEIAARYWMGIATTDDRIALNDMAKEYNDAREQTPRE